MSKASKKRQKLTKEELKEENRKLRRQMAAGLTTPEDQKRIVNRSSFSVCMSNSVRSTVEPRVWPLRSMMYSCGNNTDFCRSG